ncbi:MAG: outer membrane beta-barrel protein [Polyangiales bacterium]
MRPRFTSLWIALALCLLASSASAQERRVALRFQGGVEVGVPIFFDVDHEIVKPGASFAGWAGFDIGWVVFDFALGLQWTPIDTNKVPGAFSRTGLEPLVRLSFSPGVRFQIPIFDAVLPYVTGAFDANLWSFAALGGTCAWYYCRNDSRGQFAPGFSGKAGVGIHLKGSMYLDVGFQYSMSGKGNFFERQQWWAEPFIGFIYRGDSDRFGGTGY